MKYRFRVPVYEGPLDLLLHLIKREEIDICDIPVAKITEQYLEYLEVMQLLDLEIAGDFLVMTATLMHIKSKMLLPPKERPPEEPEEDPRQGLVNRLLEYQRYKDVAGFLGERETEHRELFARPKGADRPAAETAYIEASIFDLIGVFSKVLVGLPEGAMGSVPEDEFTLEDKMGVIVDALREQGKLLFADLLGKIKTRAEVIATFLALLELIRMKEVSVRQTDVFGGIYLMRVEKP